MASIPKIVGVMSCGFLLCLGLSNVAQASPSNHMIRGHADQKRISVRATSGHAVQGLVLLVEGDTAVVKKKDGKEVRVYLDETTSVTGKPIDPGDRIEARVNEKNHALVVFSAQ